MWARAPQENTIKTQSKTQSRTLPRLLLGAASLVLLCELAESVDNATWKEAVASALGRRLRQFLGSSGVITHESAVHAFFAGESAFFAELNSVYAKVVGK